MTLSFITIAQLAWDAGFRGEDHSIAVALTVPESGRNPEAISPINADGSQDRGLLQINSVHGYDPDRLLEPAYNMAAAREVWERQGWGAWTAYRNGLHRPSLDAAKVAMDARAQLATSAAALVSRDVQIANLRGDLASLGIRLANAEDDLVEEKASTVALRAAVAAELDAVLGRLTALRSTVA